MKSQQKGFFPKVRINVTDFNDFFFFILHPKFSHWLWFVAAMFTDAALPNDQLQKKCSFKTKSNFCFVFAIEFQMPIIKLKSADGAILETDVEVAKCSGTIKDMLENGMIVEDEDEEVPLPNVKSSVLRKVWEWAEHHKDDKPKDEDNRPKDDNNKKKEDTISEWDAEFLNVDHSTLFDLILAANYLNIKGLLEVTTKNLASMMKGKSAEAIRNIFNIKNDFTEAEKEEMAKEIEWCEEKK